MSKKVTSVKTHYPSMIQVLTWDVVGAMLDAELSEEAIEKFQDLLRRAYSMGHRDGCEKAEREGYHLVETAQWYNQQNQKLDQLKEFLAETFGWEQREDEWDEEYEERAWEEEDDCWD